MLGTKPFLAVLVLTALISISLSNTRQQQGAGLLSRLFAKGKGILSLSASALSGSKTASSRSYTLKNGTQIAAASVGEARGGGGGGGGGWGYPEESSGWGGSSGGGGWGKSAGGGGWGGSGGGGWGGGGGGGGGGWGGGGGGWGGGGGGWPMMMDKGFDLNKLIGALAFLGIAGVALSALSRPASTTIMMMNTTGRRRRATDDFEDEMLEGESLAEFLSRVGKYFNSDWSEDNKTKKVEPVKLY